MKHIRAARGGPRPVGPYAQAVVANGLVFTAGQVPAVPGGDMPVDFAGQVRQTFANLATVLAEAGSDLSQVVKVNAYLAEEDRMEEFNEIYREIFGPGHVPARTTVAVGLWGVRLEVDCVAVCPSESHA
ncbi:RidA family protein [Streptomyces sp. NA02950]|uniref:RidA family protein n=1 Tax=Streptomyces sp. NA02950 TaxID=2742137 RepID=UPI001590F751|nr:RidA family protein [Streptomyces sp. NA02950]QKV91376.1 RidA family protein [Streptomyces sp. NA02950]